MSLTGQHHIRRLAITPGYPDCHGCPPTFTVIANAVLSGAYAYWSELNAPSFDRSPDAPPVQTVICRLDLVTHKPTLDRWITPTPTGAFAIAAGSLFTTTLSPNCAPAPGIYQYVPSWAPATAPLLTEIGSPCGTIGR